MVRWMEPWEQRNKFEKTGPLLLRKSLKSPSYVFTVYVQTEEYTTTLRCCCIKMLNKNFNSEVEGSLEGDIFDLKLCLHHACAGLQEGW